MNPPPVCCFHETRRETASNMAGRVESVIYVCCYCGREAVVRTVWERVRPDGHGPHAPVSLRARLDPRNPPAARERLCTAPRR